MKFEDKHPLFSIHDGEVFINGETAWAMFQEFGFPPEMFREEVARLLKTVGDEHIKRLIVKSWIMHLTDDQIDSMRATLEFRNAVKKFREIRYDTGTERTSNQDAERGTTD